MKKILLGIFILLIAAILLAPTLLSTGWGKNLILGFVERSSNYKITLDNLSLSWFGPQTLEHLQVREKAGEPFASCERISCSAPLWRLVIGSRNFQDLHVIKPSLTLQTQALSQPVSFIKIKKASLLPSADLNLSFLPSGVDLKLEDGEFTLLHGKTLLVGYHKLQIQAEIPVSRESAKWDLSGETTEGNITGTFNSVGKMDAQDRFSTSTKFVNFPLRGIDALLSHFHPEAEGLLVEAFGASLNLSLEGSFSRDKLACSLSLRSPLLTAQLQTTSGANSILLSQPGKISFTATPSFVKKASKSFPLLGNFTLESPLLMQFTIEEFNLPVRDQKADFEALALTASLATEFEKKPITARAAITSAKEQRLIKLEATSPFFSLAQAAFKLDEKRVALTSPATLIIAPSKAALASFLPEKISPQKELSCEFTITSFSLPLEKKIQDVQLQAEFKTSPLSFEKFYEMNAIEFPPVKGRVDLSTLHAITLHADFEPKSGDLLTLSATGDLDLTKETLRMNSNITLSEHGKKWGAGKIGLDAAQILSPKPVWNFTIDAQGQEINIKGALNLQNDSLRLQKEPLEIYFTLTDESFARIEKWLTQKPPAFQLSQPSVFALSISRLSFPLTAGWKEMLIVAEGGFDKFAFQDKGTGQQVKLNNFQIKIEKKDTRSSLSFNLDSQIATREGQDGKICCQARLLDLNDSEHPSIELNLDVVQLPTAILDLAAHLRTQGSFSPLFGDKIDASANVQLEKGSGPVELNVNSPNTRLSVKGAVREGILSLSEPAHAQVVMTKELSDMLLKEVNPLSISSIASSNPFTLQIDSAGFSLPLHALRKLSLSHAKIELGQISCRNDGSLQTVLGLLKSKDQTSGDQLRLWFAPIEFSIKEGAVSLERSEILINQTYEIATWGNLDLQSEMVDMILGLTAQCLSKAFAIKNLPSDYVLQIPMRGKLNDVKLDTKSATAKIAALMVWQQSSVLDSSKGGIIGKGFGEFLGRMATLPDRGDPAPPAKRPFPWDKYKASGKERKSEKSNEPAPKKKNRIRKEDKPLKQLLKILR